MTNLANRYCILCIEIVFCPRKCNIAVTLGQPNLGGEEKNVLKLDRYKVVELHYHSTLYSNLLIKIAIQVESFLCAF